jgi:predicted secreted hydrolase
MAHFALSDKQEKRFFFRDRANRGFGGKAGALVHRYLVWNEDWKVEGKGESHVIDVKDRDRSLRLRLTPLKPPVLHGQNGLSSKGEGKGRASYYYSLTRLKTEGVLEIGEKVKTVHGLTWMDHEFGSDQLGKDQVGWDWFSVQLDNETEIMLYLIRRQDGSVDPHSSGTLIYQDGTARHLTLKEFRVDILKRWKSSHSGGVYPMRWKVSIPDEGVDLEVNPFFPQQELDTKKSTRETYWEGSVKVSGTYQKKPTKGLGYVEMTGYVGKLRM